MPWTKKNRPETVGFLQVVVAADLGSIPYSRRILAPGLCFQPLRKNAELWTHWSGFLILPHDYASVTPPKNGPTHAVVDCALRRVIVGRRQMSWQIHAVVKQPQNIDV